MKPRAPIFGREPVVWVALIESALTMAMVLFRLPVSTDQLALIVAGLVAIGGVVTAYLTKDPPLAAVVGLVKATLAIAIGFGLTLSFTQTAAVISFTTLFMGLFNRQNTEPAPGTQTNDA